MAETTRKLAASTRSQFFFVASTTASTRCLVQNFQPICYSHRVMPRHNIQRRGGSRCSKWPNLTGWLPGVKHCWLLVPRGGGGAADQGILFGLRIRDRVSFSSLTLKQGARFVRSLRAGTPRQGAYSQYCLALSRWF